MRQGEPQKEPAPPNNFRLVTVVRWASRQVLDLTRSQRFGSPKNDGPLTFPHRMFDWLARHERVARYEDHCSPGILALSPIRPEDLVTLIVVAMLTCMTLVLSAPGGFQTLRLKRKLSHNSEALST